jgi:5-formyltetrahydrofolate cyclo-ligase
MISKTTIRKMLKQYKSDVCPQYLYYASAFIVQQIESHPRFFTANRISIFNALPDEPSTFELIKRWCDSKEIYLPVITGGAIQLARYSSDSCTRTGLYNIIEPVTDEYFTDYASLDLILVPGVAFDETGNRLGRGRGYYDELMSRPGFENVYKIGVCFDFQKFRTLPTDLHDIRVDEVI